MQLNGGTPVYAERPVESGSTCAAAPTLRARDGDPILAGRTVVELRSAAGHRVAAGNDE